MKIKATKGFEIFLIMICILIFTCSKSNKPTRTLIFNENQTSLNCDLIFPNSEFDEELIQIKTEYKLDSLIKSAATDSERALTLLNWSNSRWEHDGDTQPLKNNALSILKQAEEGGKFRCVEYGIVLSAVLNAVNIPTRTLALKTKDCETRIAGAGHVVSEAYLPDLEKWVFLDGQLNYIPYLKGVPLNAVEFQKAIVENRDAIKMKNYYGFTKPSDADKVDKLINWIEEYLYFFDVDFDSTEKKKKCGGKSKLMLVPLGVNPPKVFQAKHKLNNFIYTSNLNDFYKKPKMN